MQPNCFIFSAANDAINSALTYMVCRVLNSKIRSVDGDSVGWLTEQAMAQSSGAHMVKDHGWLTLNLLKSTQQIAA